MSIWLNNTGLYGWLHKCGKKHITCGEDNGLGTTDSTQWSQLHRHETIIATWPILRKNVFCSIMIFFCFCKFFIKESLQSRIQMGQCTAVFEIYVRIELIMHFRYKSFWAVDIVKNQDGNIHDYAKRFKYFF